MVNFYRRNEVEQITGLSRASIYKFMAEEQFPRPFKIGHRAVAWRECDLKDWIKQLEVSNGYSH